MKARARFFAPIAALAAAGLVLSCANPFALKSKAKAASGSPSATASSIKVAIAPINPKVAAIFSKGAKGLATGSKALAGKAGGSRAYFSATSAHLTIYAASDNDMLYPLDYWEVNLTGSPGTTSVTVTTEHTLPVTIFTNDKGTNKYKGILRVDIYSGTTNTVSGNAPIDVVAGTTGQNISVTCQPVDTVAIDPTAYVLSSFIYDNGAITQFGEEKWFGFQGSSTGWKRITVWPVTAGATQTFALVVFDPFGKYIGEAVASSPDSAAELKFPASSGYGYTCVVVGTETNLSTPINEGFTIGEAELPAPPTNVQAVGSPGGATVTWTASAGANSYDVYYQDGAAVTLATFVGSASTEATSATITGLTNYNGMYAFMVMASANGETSAPSATAVAMSSTTHFQANFENLPLGGVYDLDSWITTQWPNPWNGDMQVTAPSGHTYGQILSYDLVGAGYGVDASRPLNLETPIDLSGSNAYRLSFDLKKNCWGTSVGLGHDFSEDGTITKTDTAEKALVFTLASIDDSATLTTPNDTVNTPAAASLIAGDAWAHVEMEFQGDLVTVKYGPVGAASLTTLFSNVAMGISAGPTKTDPSWWDMIYIHMEGAGSGVDNVSLTQLGTP